MRAQIFPFLHFFALTLFLTGCGGARVLPLLEQESADPGESARFVDPAGPIPAPSLPPELARLSDPPDQAVPAARHGKFAYTVLCELGEARTREEGRAEQSDPEAAFLVSVFARTSSLCRLADSPPGSFIELERRLASALREAEDLLRGRGYYSGTVRGEIERLADDDKAARVRVRFFPGARYRLGKSIVLVSPPASLQRDFPDIQAKIPKNLADVGLADGAPAIAADVLAAVDKALAFFPDNGFPFAAIGATRYTVDHLTQTIDAVIEIKSGPFVRMGEIDRRGAPSVAERYIQSQRRWRTGGPWRRSRVEAFRDSLRESGLFRNVDVAPAENDDAGGNRPVVTTLESAPERTFGGAVKYHSDFGPGMQGFWEHRNLTGQGDGLRVTAPVWLDMQELTARYRLPFFLRRDQDGIANVTVLNQDTDAYRLVSAVAAAGLARKLSRSWSLSLQGSVEGGNDKEPDKPARDYIMYGLPFTVSYDGTGSLLDALSGRRMTLSLAPYAGDYGGSFTALRSRAEGQAFFPLAEEDRLVLALRGVVGVVTGADSENIPPSARFYGGGGGSVRGYAYQSLGPLNEDDKALGGGSLVEFSAESRWKITSEWGLVAFVDGGGVYANVFDDADREIRWGAGFGLRYYTAVGPVRLDVATPLNPRPEDDPLQVYISIGQSF